jgi:hypothetical protein
MVGGMRPMREAFASIRGLLAQGSG